MHPDFDVAIIGAGLTGMQQLYKLRQIGLNVRVIEAGGDVGGTWHWNRYPGCTLDSESFTYGYSFAKELSDEWRWSRRYASQPEVLSYFRTFADRFDIRKDIQFNTRVESARYQEADNLWEVKTDKGDVLTARFLIAATGILSAPLTPRFPGVEDFQGEIYNTSSWPRDDNGLGGSSAIGFEGKRVGVIGTGSTGIQVIQEVSKTARELVVFQRDASWTFPLGNEDIDEEQMADIRAQYDAIMEMCNQSPGGFFCLPQATSALEVSAQEREEQFERLYNTPGFGLWLGNYYDVLQPGEANRLLGEFVARKMRSRVNDPAVADILVPKDHPFGSRRVPLETDYLEVYNQPNVRLVDVSITPISGITATGIQVGDQHFELDMIIYATGFDAVRGSIDRIDITGRGNIRLKDKWSERPITYMGLQTAGFPNFFMLPGPYHGATFCNIPRCIEHGVDWLTEMFQHLRATGVDYVEATEEAETQWTDQVHADAEPSLFMATDSFINGSNKPGARRSFLFYAAGNPAYREICENIASRGYSGFALRHVNDAAASA
ncbi:flavin-containing monooxygenase [Sphingomonas bisphenolicum]